MKKIMAIVLALTFSGFYADAACAAVSVKVPVLCEAEGDDDVYIAKMETLDDTLLETIREGLLYLKNTESGDFVMEFTEPGEYHYRVLQDKEGSSGNNFDDTAFAVDVYVSRNDDGTLVAEPVVYEMNGKEKKTAIRFLNMPKEYYEKETETETPASETEEPETGRRDPEPEIKDDIKPEGGGPSPSSGTGSGVPGTSVRTLDQTPVVFFGVLLLVSGAAAAVLSGSVAANRRKGRKGAFKR